MKNAPVPKFTPIITHAIKPEMPDVAEIPIQMPPGSRSLGGSLAMENGKLVVRTKASHIGDPNGPDATLLRDAIFGGAKEDRSPLDLLDEEAK